MVRKYNKKTKARGVDETKNGNLQIAIMFDPKTFANIKERATKDNISFGQCVRELVEMGFLYEEEDEVIIKGDFSVLEELRRHK